MAPTSTLSIPPRAAAMVARWESDIDEAARRRDLEKLNLERDQHARSCVASLNNGSLEAATIFARISAHAEARAAEVRAQILTGIERVLYRPFAVTEQLSAVDA